MRLSDYLEELKKKRIAVVGIGVSNTPLIKLLLRNGCRVTACDISGRESFGGLAEELESLGAHLRLGPDYLQNLNFDVIFKTPGMHPNVPELLEARERGALITSEMEAFFEVCPCNTIGVTGSDGKTTTTTIISELLKAAGYNVYLGGNIGKPLFAEADGMLAEDWAVLELSSFQLMTMRKSPDIAVVTNVSPNHLDIHTDMDEYVNAKKNIFLHQHRGGCLVLNAENDVTRGFANLTDLPVTMFSRKKKLHNGPFYNGKAICLAENGDVTEIIREEEIFLPGIHNIENYMAAFAATRKLVSPEIWRRVAREFKGVEHRIEKVRVFQGVTYYNDSIASSPTRTIAGLKSFDKRLILIAGGYDKQIPFDELGTEITEHVKTLILTGHTAQRIRAAVEKAAGYVVGSPEIIERADFNDAVYTAVDAACPGDIVLLSPACASFDKFKNFAERGAAFKQIVYELE